MTEQLATIPLDGSFVGKIIVGDKEVKIRIAHGGFNAVILTGDFELFENVNAGKAENAEYKHVVQYEMDNLVKSD
jgi:hypothetical protein